MERTRHFDEMLNERGIRDEWVDAAVRTPDRRETMRDGTLHLIKRIDENAGRWLRIVINTESSPHRAVTAFFDRRLRRRRDASEG